MEALEQAGRGYNVFDRGIFFSIYTSDHNGLIIELATVKFDIPDDRRGEVLALTQQIREDAGAEYAKDEHLEEALDRLGLPTEAADLPDASSGVSGLER